MSFLSRQLDAGDFLEAVGAGQGGGQQRAAQHGGPGEE